MRLLDIIIIGVMVCCVTVAVQLYYNERLRECSGNPLVYAAKFYEERYDGTFSGSASFLEEGAFGNPIIINFNSSGVSVRRENREAMLQNFSFNVSR